MIEDEKVCMLLRPAPMGIGCIQDATRLFAPLSGRSENIALGRGDHRAVEA